METMTIIFISLANAAIIFSISAFIFFVGFLFFIFRIELYHTKKQIIWIGITSLLWPIWIIYEVIKLITVDAYNRIIGK